MNTIKYKDILNTYQRIDLYRAKYRHDDFTPHAWCFHGNKEQKWTGNCQGGFLKFKGAFLYNGLISIDASLYKYFSFKFGASGAIPKFKRYKLTLNYTSTEACVKEIIVPYDGKPTTVFLDMSADPLWTEEITRVGFTLSVESTENVWAPVTTDASCEYIKFDKENVFANVLDVNTITIVDLNEMRGDVETFAKQSIDWSGPDRVRQFIDTIKKRDIDEVRNRITSLLPYNGCSTCDDYKCSCNETGYGHVPCQTCNACNQYAPCSICDKTCHEQARSCSCNTPSCYSQGSGCSCDSQCYGYSSCYCDGSCDSCYSGNTTWTRGSLETVCPYNSGCYNYDCRYQHTDEIATCSYCFKGCDVVGEKEGCRTDGQGTGGGCICNAACHEESSYSNTVYCEPTCYVERGCHGDTSQNYQKCSSCYTTCNSEQASCSSCYSGYGESGCSSCDTPTCYGQATSCSCDHGCHVEPRVCTCDGRCNSYAGCTTCDGCNTYLACSCDAKCFQESCDQCHKTGYSSVPI